MNPSYELRDTAAWIRLDDGKANVMRTEGLRALGECLDRAEKDEARAIVIRGRDGMFSGGLDVRWLPTLEPDGARELVDVFSRTMLRVLRSPIPTVGLISGHAVAGGCMLACACDRRIGVRGPYRLQMNEVAIGMPMPAWATLIASSAIPVPRLYDVLQLAEPLSFDEARSLGTLHAVAEDFEALDTAGSAAAAALSGLVPGAFARTRERLWHEPAERALALLASE